MLLLLLYELLFGNKQRIISSRSAKTNRINKLILSNKNALNSALVRLKIKRQIVDNDQLIAQIRYVYARVNVTKSTVNKVMFALTNTIGLTFIGGMSRGEIKKKTKAFWADEHIPNLLGFTANCKVAGTELVKEGVLIIQNKSSCLPAFVMDPDPSWLVLDACAAPGNKTSHLMCILHSKSADSKHSKHSKTSMSSDGTRVIALERDRKRCGILKDRLRAFGMRQSVNVQNMDFLGLSPTSDLGRKIKAILLDPTCSGSGLVNDRFGVHSEDEEGDKVESLSAAQKELVRHAMSFENVQRIVYSTCSVHEEENEKVVEWALKQCGGAFVVKTVFEKWTDRGVKSYEFGESVVRVSNANEDNLQGFFVACFERTGCSGSSTLNVSTKEMDHKEDGEEMNMMGKKRDLRSINGNVGGLAAENVDLSVHEPPKKRRKGNVQKSKKKRYLMMTSTEREYNRARRQRVNAPKSKFGARRR